MKNNEKCFFTIIIKDTDNLAAIDSLKKQTYSDYECFIVNNSVADLEKYLGTDNHFHIIESKSSDVYQNINDAIKYGNGKYFIIINSNDILTTNALAEISRTAVLTDAKIIKYHTMFAKNFPELSLQEQRCIFNYTIRRDIIMNEIFDNLSGFCFARDFIKNQEIYEPEHIFIIDALHRVPAIVLIDNIFLLQLTNRDEKKSAEYMKIIDNYKKIKQEFDDKFWRTYFKKIIPDLTLTIVTEHKRDIFVYCCKNIPLKFIPLKYKFMFFIMKIVSKN